MTLSQPVKATLTKPPLSPPDQHRPTTTKLQYYILLICLILLLPYQSALAAIDTKLHGDDRFAGPFPIGFEFSYYGEKKNQFYVSTNGLIQFKNPTINYINNCLPSHYNQTLYVFWDDLRTNVEGQPTGTIKYDTQGEAPNRKLIVQWTNQYFFYTNLPMGTFQAILYESSGDIKYQYRYLSDERSYGNSATIGIQGPNRESVQVGCNQANTLASQQAILFSPDEDGSYQVDHEAEYDFIDIADLTPSNPEVSARYTNQAPQWHWHKINDLNHYEIEIQNQNGVVVMTQGLGDTDHYIYSEGLQHAKSYMARVRGSINNGATWEIWSGLSPLTTVDLQSPSVSLMQFTRTGPRQAKINFNTLDHTSGIKAVKLQIAADPQFSQLLLEQTLNYSANSYTIDNLPTAESYFARIQATDNAGNQSPYSAIKSLIFSPPTLITPVEGAVSHNPHIDVSGITVAKGQVQLYLNDQPLDQPIQADDFGQFNRRITLDKAGKQTIAAAVKSEFASSEKSRAVNISYQSSPPSGLFVSPAEGSKISAPIEIEISALDQAAIDYVELLIDGSTVAKLKQQPYQFYWDVTQFNNGRHQLTAIIRNIYGKQLTLTRDVTITLTPPEVQTPYSGEIAGINPAISYGYQPIEITGRASSRDQQQAVANSPLKLVLNVNGLNRVINVVSDSEGAFNYQFVPDENDRGLYKVSVLHPKEDGHQPSGQFTIERLRLNRYHYPLTTARNIPTAIDLTVSADSDLPNLSWHLAAVDQPNGTLPPGISIADDKPINIAGSKTSAMRITATIDDSAADHGTFILRASSADDRQTIRAKLQVNYQLKTAQPALYAEPNQIEIGVKRGESDNEPLMIGNRGLSSAINTRVHLTDTEGNKPPDWIFIANAEKIGAVDANHQHPIQLNVQPDNSVSEGIYHFKLHVEADNDNGGDVPVMVAVTAQGEGSVRFNVADMYTATLDQDGQPIAGVKDARITLQHDSIPSLQYTLTTDSQGQALSPAIAPGIYRYRASAAEHQDSSGRLRIRPGVTTSQAIFLDYPLINIEFSVTETTIKDSYDVVLHATYNTQVPAPVVLLEPLSINLNGMQVGEEKTGQLTLTNYGLIQADNLRFNAPASDHRFKYEFFNDIPDSLPPKTRIVIPYKVTALSGAKSNRVFTRSAGTNLAECYSAPYSESHNYTCANGDTSGGGMSGSFNAMPNAQCFGWLNLPQFNLGWASGKSPSSMPMAPQCVADCNDGNCCKANGTKPAH